MVPDKETNLPQCLLFVNSCMTFVNSSIDNISSLASCHYRACYFQDGNTYRYIRLPCHISHALLLHYSYVGN